MEFLFDIIFELYLELMMFIVPENNAKTKKCLTLFFAVFVLFGVLALFVWGCVLICDYKNWLGIIPIGIAAVISFVQIIAGFVLHNKRGK